LEGLVWAKVIGGRYYSHIIWVPMILLLANKNIPRVLLYEKSRQPLQPCYFKNMISTYPKYFSWRKRTKNFQDFERDFFWKLPVFMFKSNSGKWGLHAKHERQHQCQKALERSILRKFVGWDVLNATHSLSSLLPTKPLQISSFYKR
jgi:hypothetical protein